ncbi:hypothetical protein KIPB_002211 [Kipferlia bialata]|uniref:VOC domain-containing protein n=1 Tax=Kipferlia bialata TaxID=797122 RepID=A0A9K3CRX6_9EUKA|nr:hypothetical protein KIPB_002211 [Kipferlia bialata]|eukprot:g2211.t1
MNHNQIGFIEFPSSDLSASKTFFTTVFGWTFKDFGEKYTAFSESGPHGGFFLSDAKSSVATGGALVVIHSDDLEKTQAAVEANGGKVVKAIFAFPGGRRFHFTDTTGNEWAVSGK